MKIATLAMVLNADGELLLGEKKRGEIGTGVLSGPGGKLEQGESLQACVLRETREEFELELDPETLEARVCIDFYAGSAVDFRVHVFAASILSGTPHETADMYAPQWYATRDLPYARMFGGDAHWMPAFFMGGKFCAHVHYRERAKGFEYIEFLPFAS